MNWKAASITALSAATLLAFAAGTPMSAGSALASADPALSAPQWQCDDATGAACGQNLWAIDMLTPEVGWAVGSSGLILRYDGTAWQLEDSPVGVRLGALDMFSEAVGWAVGSAADWTGCAIVHYQDPVWDSQACPADLPTKAALHDVAAVSSEEAWAVGSDGDSGVILHYTGGVWSITQRLPGIRPQRLDILSPSQGWLACSSGEVGVSGPWSVVFYRLADGRWEPFVVPIDVGGYTKFDGIVALSDSAWAFATRIREYVSPLGHPYLVEDALVFRFASESWQLEEIQGIALTGGIAESSDEAWALGYRDEEPVLTRLSQVQPEHIPITVTASALLAIDAAAPDDLWMVGTGGSIVRRIDDTFRLVSEMTTGYVHAVEAVARDEAWAMASDHFVHFEGGSWTRVDAPTGGRQLTSFSMTNASEGWAVGQGGRLLQYSGGKWTEHESPTTDDLKHVHMSSSDSGIAVGHSGTIIRYDGSRWREALEATPGLSLRSGHELPSGEAWVVGHRMVDDDWSCGILHRIDGTWQSVNCPISHPLYDVEFAGPDDGWAVGVSGTILRYHNGGWGRFASPTEEDLVALNLAGRDDGFAVGSGGVILRLTQGRWRIERSPVAASLSDVSEDAHGEAWAVGSGVILRREPGDVFAAYLPLAQSLRAGPGSCYRRPQNRSAGQSMSRATSP